MVALDGCPLTMELDTGAAVFLMSEQAYNTLTFHFMSRLWYSSPTRESLSVGQREVEVSAEQEKSLLLLVVVAERLFGRDRLQVICLNWRAIWQACETAAVVRALRSV